MRLGVAARTLRALDVLVVAWTLAWIAIAFAVGREVHGLRELSATVVAAGVATEQTGKAVGSLETLPLIGDDVDRVGARTEEAGRSAQASGRASGESIQDLAVLLALAIALAPTVPLLAVYVPARRARADEARAIRRAVADAGGDPVFLAFLARRAVENLPFRQVRAISSAPWRDLREGRYEALARAELRRLGIEPREPSRRSLRPAS